MSDTVEAEVVACRYCGRYTVLMGDMAQCPGGCPGHFRIMQVCRIPAGGVKKALAKAGHVEGPVVKQSLTPARGRHCGE